MVTVQPDPDPLRAWARSRRLKLHAWLGALASLVVVPVLALAGIEAREEATLSALGMAFAMLIATTLVAVFQQCPRCHKQWNMRGLFGFSTPYSPSCLNCRLPAPDPGPNDRRRLSLVLWFAPTLAAAGAFALGQWAPPPGPPPVRTGVSVDALDGVREGLSHISFVDGAPRPDLLGSYVRKQAIYQLVPLVPDRWTPQDPVRVWVMCAPSRETGDCIDPERWLAKLSLPGSTPLQYARVIQHADVTAEDTGWRLATEDARQRHGIVTHPRALVVGWPGYVPRE